MAKTKKKKKKEVNDDIKKYHKQRPLDCYGIGSKSKVGKISFSLGRPINDWLGKW